MKSSWHWYFRFISVLAQKLINDLSFINFFVKERRTVVGLCLLIMIFSKYVISFIRYFRLSVI